MPSVQALQWAAEFKLQFELWGAVAWAQDSEQAAIHIAKGTHPGNCTLMAGAGDSTLAWG